MTSSEDSPRQEYVPPAFAGPYRVLLLAAATQGWFQAPDQTTRERVVARMRHFFAEWERRGATLLASMDDDYFLVGQPTSLEYTIFVIYDVPDLTIAADLIQSVREPVADVRLDMYFRFEVRVGRQLFLVDH
jgi:hypothetical protein